MLNLILALSRGRLKRFAEVSKPVHQVRRHMEEVDAAVRRAGKSDLLNSSTPCLASSFVPLPSEWSRFHVKCSQQLAKPLSGAVSLAKPTPKV